MGANLMIVAHHIAALILVARTQLRQASASPIPVVIETVPLTLGCYLATGSAKEAFRTVVPPRSPPPHFATWMEHVLTI